MLVKDNFVAGLLATVPLVAASFYDNPKLEPPPEAGTPLFHLEKKYGTDFVFSGISTFAHVKHIRCLTTPYEPYDIAIIGAPFDTAVTYRPELDHPHIYDMALQRFDTDGDATGARFGPRAIRTASARMSSFLGFNHRAGVNPWRSWPLILDCGDIPITPVDNALALYQMESAFLELLSRKPLSQGIPPNHIHPKIVTLGGDHSIALPTLRALHKTYKQPIAVLHFDAHLDTWHPRRYPSTWIDASDPSQADFNHGSMFWLASQEGLIHNSSSVHAGLRTRLAGDDYSDYDDDDQQGFLRIEADDIDIIGVQGIVDLIMTKIGTDVPVYLSIDIDTIDPGIAPGTGTPEPGGWTTRELIQILRGIEDLNLVAADIVEVAPAYDDRGEGTALAAAQAVYEMLSSIVKKGLKDRGEWVEKVKPGQAWKQKYTAANAGKANVLAQASDKVKAAAETVSAAAAAGTGSGSGGWMDRIKAAVDAFENPSAPKEDAGAKETKDEL